MQDVRVSTRRCIICVSPKACMSFLFGLAGPLFFTGAGRMRCRGREAARGLLIVVWSLIVPSRAAASTLGVIFYPPPLLLLILLLLSFNSPPLQRCFFSLWLLVHRTLFEWFLLLELNQTLRCDEDLIGALIIFEDGLNILAWFRANCKNDFEMLDFA